MQRGILVVAFLLLSSVVAHGATYYVRTDGNNINDGLTNTPGGAWDTIDWAAANVAAGDVVRVQAGTYPERLTVQISGSAGNPITFIADGAVTFCTMSVSSKNYVRIIGFTIDTDAGGCTKMNRAVTVSGINTGLEFWNNTIRDAHYAAIGHGSYADRHNNFVVIGNTFTAIGGPSGSAVALRGNHNILAYNELTASDPDVFQIDGNYSYWLNNSIVMKVTNPAHGDVFQSNASSLGLSYNLFEANFIVGTGIATDEHGALLQNQSASSCSTGICGAVTENLFRYNVWHNNSSVALSVTGAVVGPIARTRQVHDTLASMMRTQPTTAYVNMFRGTGTTAYLFNNLNYKAWGDGVASGVQVFFVDTGASIAGADYNLAFTPDRTLSFAPPWTAQAHPLSNVDPSFVNHATDDFTLGAASAARSRGGRLTTASGSGSGTTFQVATGGGGFFRGRNASVSQYGGNLTAGDVITVGTTTRTIASVAGDAITVTSPFTWAHGDPVFLGTSTTPDVGAYPYRAEGYGLAASYAVSGGIATVTPSDDSLVRFVVCYRDGIPTTVDNASPYTCPAAPGSLAVRVYPRYASKTRFIPATLGPAAPTAPTNLRIVPLRNHASSRARAPRSAKRGIDSDSSGSSAHGSRNPTRRSHVLIINADDWGGWPEATDAAFECFGRSWISSASAMVFMADSLRGAELARQCGIDVGLHLNLNQEFTGEKVPDAIRARHMQVARFLNANRYAQIIYNPMLRAPLELLVRTQIEEFERLYGKAPSHIDGHQHMHLCANMVIANHLPARFKVRRSFSFRPGEKNWLNRAYRSWLDRRVCKRHRVDRLLFCAFPKCYC